MKNELHKEKSKDTDIDVKTIIIAIVAIVLFVAVIIIIEHFLIGILVFLVFGWVAIKTMCGL